jgi:hypothetical protein
MYSDLAAALQAATEDAVALVPWAAPNADALQEEWLEAAVLHAIGGPVPDDFAVGVPLLRFANGAPAMPLLDAVLNPPIPRRQGGRSHRCDVFGTTMREPNTLWVPCGASVVQVTMRNFARGILEDVTRTASRLPRLVWC